MKRQHTVTFAGVTMGAAFSTINNASKIAVSACRVVTNAVINTAGDTATAMCMGEKMSIKNQIESFAGSVLWSSLGLTVSSKVNSRKFSNLTKKDKRLALKGFNKSTTPITNRMIK